MKQSRWVMIVLTVCLLLVTMSILPAADNVQAGGAGGVLVELTRVCLDGVQFSGTVNMPEALNRTYNSLILRGYVGIPEPVVATGNSHTYTTLNEIASFTIRYPIGTFAVGEEVTYTAYSNGYGGGQHTTVSECQLFNDAQPIPEPAVSPALSPSRVMPDVQPAMPSVPIASPEIITFTCVEGLIMGYIPYASFAWEVTNANHVSLQSGSIQNGLFYPGTWYFEDDLLPIGSVGFEMKINNYVGRLCIEDPTIPGQPICALCNPFE